MRVVPAGVVCGAAYLVHAVEVDEEDIVVRVLCGARPKCICYSRGPVTCSRCRKREERMRKQLTEQDKVRAAAGVTPTRPTAKAKKPKLAKVRSLAELRALADADPRYLALALAAARNLGGEAKNLDEAMRWLSTNAQETDEGEGGGEAGVIGEVNYCRDLV